MSSQQPREIPLPFSPEMMRATLAGRKTVTRRIVRPQWPRDVQPKEHSAIPGYWLPYGADGRLRNDLVGSRKDDCGIWCPYGFAGCKYYLREHFRFVLDRPAIEYVADGEVWELPATHADGQDRRQWWAEGVEKHGGNLRPPMFLPKWASRHWRECVSIRMEPLHAMTGIEAFREGIQLEGVAPQSLTHQWDMALRKFRLLWDGINGHRPGCSWADAPWVFRVETKGV